MFLLLTSNSKGHFNVLSLLFSIHLVPLNSKQTKEKGKKIPLLPGG